MKSDVARIVSFATLSLALCVPRAFSDVYTWTNGGANLAWDDFSPNWTTGSGDTAWIDGNTVVFGATGAGTIHVSGVRTITGLTTNAGGYTLRDGTIVLGSASTPFVINNLITIQSALSGDTNGIVKTGAGSLILSGGLANSFAGGIEVNAGRLSNANGASLKNVSGTITVAEGATFNAQQNFDSHTITNEIVLSGNGTGYDGHGALNVATNATLNGAIILLGSTKITHDWNAAGISGPVTGVDTNLQLTNLQAGQPGLSINGPIQLGSGSITIQSAAGAGFVSLGGTNSYTGGTRIGTGGLSISKGAALGSGDVTFTASTFLRGSANLTQANKLVIGSGIQASLNAVSGSTFTQSGAVTGEGTLTATGAGSVLLSGGLENTFSGPITVSSGRFGCINGASMKNLPGTVTVAAGATFDVQQGFDGHSVGNSFILSGSGSGIGQQGALNLQGNANLTGAITLLTDAKITHDWNSATISGPVSGTDTSLHLTTMNPSQPGIQISGPVSLGTGGLTVTSAGGTSPVILSGALSYTGETRVETGILSLSGNARLGDHSTVRIDSGAVLDLSFTGTDAVGALYLGDQEMAPGTYGSPDSEAEFKSQDFAGSGILAVGGTGSGYAVWAAANAGGQSSEEDFDGDGVPNGVEYFMGESGPGFTANPAMTGNSIVWPKDPAVSATYVVEASVNLKDEEVPGDGGWSPVTEGVADNGTSVIYTAVPNSPKRFVRLRVTVAP